MGQRCCGHEGGIELCLRECGQLARRRLVCVLGTPQNARGTLAVVAVVARIQMERNSGMRRVREEKKDTLKGGGENTERQENEPIMGNFLGKKELQKYWTRGMHPFAQKRTCGSYAASDGAHAEKAAIPMRSDKQMEGNS